MLLTNSKFNSLFVSANDDFLCSIIAKAHASIAFVGTGLSKKVVSALLQKHELIKIVVVDNDEMVYRSGYSDALAVQTLKDAGIKIQVVKNIRLNILAIDNEALVYSPTPLVIENTSQDGYPGGVMVKYAAVKDIFDNLLIKDQKTYDQSTPISGSTLVTKELTDQEMTVAVEKIKDNPPQFDLSKRLNVYTNKIQFIEIQLRGFNLKQHTVKIPKELLQLTKQNAQLRDQLSASYTIFTDENSKLAKNAKMIVDDVENLRKDLTVQLKGYGVVFVLSDKNKIEAKREQINEKIQKVKEKAEGDLTKALEKSRSNIVRILYPLVKQNPPLSLTRYLNPEDKLTREDIEKYIYRKLDTSFAKVEDFTEGMKLSISYKDVTIEMIKDPSFVKAVMDTELSMAFRNTPIVTEQTAIAERKA